jgi:hypothetical protein
LRNCENGAALTACGLFIYIPTLISQLIPGVPGLSIGEVTFKLGDTFLCLVYLEGNQRCHYDCGV